MSKWTKLQRKIDNIYYYGRDLSKWLPVTDRSSKWSNDKEYLKKFFIMIKNIWTIEFSVVT